MYLTTWKPLAFRVARHVAGDAKLRLNHKLKKVGATRFERATSCSQSRRSSQAELRPDSHRRDACTCEQVCWERRLSDLFDDRRTRRVANKTRSRKVHSAVFFRGRQERPKSSSHGPKVRSEIAFFTPKHHVSRLRSPDLAKEQLFRAPKISGNPEVQSSDPSLTPDRTYLNKRHTTTTLLSFTKKMMNAMTPMNQSIVVGRKWSGKVADQPRGHPFRVPKPVCNRKTCTRPHPF